MEKQIFKQCFQVEICQKNIFFPAVAYKSPSQQRKLKLLLKNHIQQHSALIKDKKSRNLRSFVSSLQ